MCIAQKGTRVALLYARNSPLTRRSAAIWRQYHSRAELLYPSHCFYRLAHSCCNLCCVSDVVFNIFIFASGMFWLLSVLGLFLCKMQLDAVERLVVMSELTLLILVFILFWTYSASTFWNTVKLHQQVATREKPRSVLAKLNAWDD